jgi:peptide-methionine (S)-S-oxide reductase
VVSYEDLLDYFFENHKPFSQPWSVQYKSAIYYANEDQKLAAEQKVAALEEENGGTIYTDILPLETFYIAEAYHHKYYLRKNHLLTDELEARYPTLEEFLDAPIVTWINAYVFGCGQLDDLQEELPSFGLSPEAEELLKEIVGKNSWPKATCGS